MELGLTQGQVSERTGLTQTSISRYETGAANPSEPSLRLLAFIYGKKFEWFFGEREQGHPSDYLTGLAAATHSAPPQTDPLEELLGLVRETHRLLAEHAADRSSHR